ncbi:U-box domain-containing protein 35 isoform C [Glycine soja]|uniref:U-box domain-containing protein 35 isoform C n=1 Tax=Glycine soja TaxID=3848 RepID=A0A445IGD7_GLYSO|nr:U-box domain-containing protein 35 isoform C [Glycine soja]
MWLPSPKASGIRKGGGVNGLVAVAIDKDKGSQYALKWAVDCLLTRGQTLILIHVLHGTSSPVSTLGTSWQRCRSSQLWFWTAEMVRWRLVGHCRKITEDCGEAEVIKLTWPQFRGNEAIICNINSSSASSQSYQLDNNIKDLFLTFHCYCRRKEIQCLDVLLEDTDVVKAITEYVSYAAIENLVVGATSRHGFIRFKSSASSSISKGAPDFCNVSVISKGKVSSVRKATRPTSHTSPLLSHIHDLNNRGKNQHEISSRPMNLGDRTSIKPHGWLDESIKSPFVRGRGMDGMSCMDFPESDTDISFVSSERPSSARSSSVYDYIDVGRTSRVSTNSDRSFGSTRLGALKFNNPNSPDTSFSHESSATSFSYSLQSEDEAAEADMRRLKLELKQTIKMYSTACRQALASQHKLMELTHLRLEEEKKIQEARLAQEAAMAIAEKEKARCRVAMETAEASKKIAEVETHRRAGVEVKALKEAEEKRKLLDNLALTDVRYRRYCVEEIEAATNYFSELQRIGEGGYGPVYKCYLDHTPVAVKVLRPDAAQGKSQFQQEIDILSCMRHPNMVLLLGACPEYGILIYEYMANGSLEDCLFKKKNKRVLSWQLRFRIAAEIGTGLLFLHQAKPEPLVHRDLKPGNILLDQNYVSKISDVGLARLVPAVAENVTQCCMTSAAGTFCYIDPEYQQTGMLGVKSDVYSLGIIFLQLLTGRAPIGLAHHAEESIEKDTFVEMLDPSVTDWPLEQALCLAKIAVKCAELRRKDRPDLAKLVLPELDKLRDFAEQNMTMTMPIILGCTTPSPSHSEASMQQDVISDLQLAHSESSSAPSTPTEGKP